MLMFKKWRTILLATSLLLGSVSPTVISGVSHSVYAQQTQADQALSNVPEATFKDSDVVKVIVKLKEDTVSPELLKTQEGRNERKESTKFLRQSVLDEIQAKGITYQKLFEYDLLFNGFALELTYAQAKQVQALDRVESVEVTVDYEAPKVEATSTMLPPALLGQAIDSNNLIDVQALWNKGIKGQGQIVAVIDSGIDSNHDILRMTDMTQAKYPNAEAMQKAKEKAGINYGKWYNDKLIFGFNYAEWNNDLKEEAKQSHGMHVSGTAVGNPSAPAPNGDYVAGVAPEAQLMFMRVFSDKLGKGTSSFIYIKAIEDAVALGADSINMSLGAASGSVLEVGDAVNQAIELARQAGVTVVIAAGNSGTFGYGYAQPYASNPDYGLVGNPSVAYDSISVAAVNNTAISQEIVTVKQLAGNSEFSNGKNSIATYATLFEPTQEYHYVYANLGKSTDFEGLDLTGKIALIQRGEITFTEKVKNAREAGAIGVVVFNHEVGGDELPRMALEGADKTYPIVSIGHSLGLELSKHSDTYTLQFDGKNIKTTSDKGNTLTDFTSWGLSSDGELKPDLTAPGGDVYSSYNDGTYGLSNGTSMASPHVAGAVTLVKQVLKQRFPNKTAAEIQALVKHLLMSHAKLNVNNDTKAYTSPRQQGAGVINTTKAALGDLYVTGVNDYGSVSLGNVSDYFTFDVIVHNVSHQARELNYVTYVNTDDVKDGRMTLQPRQLLAQAGSSTVHVPANGSVRVNITVDTQQYTEELQNMMPNGYYLEGFIKFSDATTQLDEVSIPYVAFKGNFQDLAVLEKPIYDFTGQEKPFYYYSNPQANRRDMDNHMTALMTSYKTPQGKMEMTVLGEYADAQGETVFDRTKLAISPNGDYKQDDVRLKAVIFRNFENMKLSIYAKDDVNRENPLYEEGNDRGRKTYFDNGQSVKSKLLQSTLWHGQDNEGHLLPDGEYQYVVTYLPESSAGKMQETSFLVKIDTVAPKIENITSQYNKETHQFKPTHIEETGSGVYKTQLVYKDVINTPDGKTQEVEYEIEPNEDGGYTIPEHVSLEQVRFTVIDYAANETSLYLDGTPVQQDAVNQAEEPQKVNENKLPEGQGIIEVKLDIDGYSYNQPLSVLRYRVTNEAGELVGDLMSVNDHIYHVLPYGKYKVEIVLLDEELEVVGERSVDVELTTNKRKQEVVFETKIISMNKMSVRFGKLPPAQTKVYAVNDKGQRFVLPQSKYDPFVFEKRLVNGQYTFVVELPEGYTTQPAELTYQVDNTINVLHVELVEPSYVLHVATLPDKSIIGDVQLAQPILSMTHLVVNELDDTMAQPLYQAVAKLEDVNKYQMKYYDIHLMRNHVKVTAEGTRTVTLQGIGQVVKVYHEKADGTLELLPHQLSEDKVIFTTDSFSNFVMLMEKEQPHVTAVNKEDLQAAMNEVDQVLTSDAYKYDTVVNQSAYNEAVIQAKRVLNDDNATQAQVDDALQTLKNAAASLVGKAPVVVKSDETTSSSGSTVMETTSSQTFETSSSQVLSRDHSTKSPMYSNSDSGASSGKNDASLDVTASVSTVETKEAGQQLPMTGQESSLVMVGSLMTIIGGVMFVMKRKTEKE